MGQYYRKISLRDMQEYEKQEQGNTGYDIRINHRDIVEKLYSLFLSSLEVEYSYCRDCAENRRNYRSYKGYEESVVDYLGFKSDRIVLTPLVPKTIIADEFVFPHSSRNMPLPPVYKTECRNSLLLPDIFQNYSFSDSRTAMS